MRFRVITFNQKRVAAAVFRTIPTKILTLAELNAPDIFKEISLKKRGIVLVTGPGRSRTLAAMVNHVNEHARILTIEDPIEFVHESKNSLINQLELNEHTHVFDNALRSTLREDPSVILVGEWGI